jgi:polyphosphate kinase 2 (PPK2 family)
MPSNELHAQWQRAAKAVHISKEEQAERFRARLEDATKRWKFSARPEYPRALECFQKAYEDAYRCSTDTRPGTSFRESQMYRDYVIAQITVKAVEKLT